jgi:hypothetical protein
MERGGLEVATGTITAGFVVPAALCGVSLSAATS